MNKKLLYSTIVILFFISCQRQEKDLCFYDNGNLYSETYLEDSFRHVVLYFNNGNIDCKLSTLINDSLLQNRLDEYYPDGFHKNLCNKTNGRGITPKEMCKTSGYNIEIDFGPYETLKNGKRVRPFRTFVENVDKHEYLVISCDTSGIDTLFKKMSPSFKSYKIICNTDTSIKEIDESLYTYYIDDLPRITHKDSSGENYFFIDFYYKSALTPRRPNDSREVIMHDSLNWEVREYDVKYIEE